MDRTSDRIIVFDGYCHVCSGGVRFVLRHPVEPPFRMVPMQSDEGRELLIAAGIDPDDPSTFLVIDGGKVFMQSDAGIHMLATVGGVWRLARAGLIVPRGLRDALYRVLARNRYRWFGRRATCFLPGAPQR